MIEYIIIISGNFLLLTNLINKLLNNNCFIMNSNNSIEITLQNIPRERLIAYLRRNFFSLNNDDDDESVYDMNENEENISTESNMSYKNEEYIDFRVYPLKIDWKEVEDYSNNLYDIYDVFGCFGISTFSLLSNVTNLSMKYNDYIFSVLNFYYNSYKKKQYQNIHNLYSNLPPLDKIHFLLCNKMIVKKEIIIVKIVLDLYEHIIFKGNFSLNSKGEELIIKVMTVFYEEILTDEDIKTIHEVLEKEMKRTFELLTKMKIKVYKSKEKYIKHINKIYRKNIMLKKGIKKELFIM